MGQGAALLQSVSRPEEWGGGPSSLNHFIALPNGTPFEMLRIYRVLRDAVPDISDAVWTWKRLCHSGYTLRLSGKDAESGRAILDALESRVNAHDGGLTGLLDIFYASLFTFGAAALEVVPGRARRRVHNIVPVDIWTLRFRNQGGGLEAYQLHEEEALRLPKDLLFYMGLDRDGTNPYGRSMLRALPDVVRIQQQLLTDMASATHNAGWNKLHVQYNPGEPRPQETAAAYEKRVLDELSQIRASMGSTRPNSNLVTFNNVEVSVLNGNQQHQVFYDNQKAVEEQMITGMHMMPVLMGRNYGSTETYGTAQFEVVNRQVETVNRRVKKLLERLFNLELSLHGVDARAEVVMKSNRTVDILKEARARSEEIDSTLRLLDGGLITLEEAKELTRSF